MGCDIRVDPLHYYEAGVARSLWSHHKCGKWEISAANVVRDTPRTHGKIVHGLFLSALL
jgi:hypothetical protein